MDPITVVIADDILNTREDVKRLLFFEEDIKVVGEAKDGEEAIKVVQQLKPDVVLMDINMPGLDGIAATERITDKVPQTAVVIISIQGEQEYLRKAMAAGAGEYLVKPFSSQELADAIRRVNDKMKRRQGSIIKLQEASEPEAPGRIVAVFSTKGGAGRTTLACNLSAVLAQEFRKRVAVVDLDVVAGDVAVLYNLVLPGSIGELAREAEINKEVIEGYIAKHLSGVKILGAIPTREEDPSEVAGRIPEILELLRQECNYVLVDTPPVLNAAVAQVLDIADDILVVGGSDLPALRRLKADLEFLATHQLGEKVHVVLNNASFEGGLKLTDVEKTLGLNSIYTISADARTLQAAANKGIPFVIMSKTSRAAQDIYRLAERFTGQETVKKGEKRSIIGKLLTF
ncbi:MAG: response regulator [Bacillota bacterium]